MSKLARNSVVPLFLIISLPLFMLPEVILEPDHAVNSASAAVAQPTQQLAQKPIQQTTDQLDQKQPQQIAQQPTQQIAEKPVEKQAPKQDGWRKLELVATAYNSLEGQTDSTPDIAAWGDKLKPGMKSIAVSRDLLKMGLKRGSKVRIVGMEGEYVVLDKMNKRWKKRIDIYMGVSVKAARNFGKRKVVMHYKPHKPLLIAENN